MRVAKLDRYDLRNNPMDSSASFTVWFSGCDFRCKGCQNEVLWDKNFGDEMTPNYIAEVIVRASNATGVQSVVLLGGEPLQQDREELLSLCRLLKWYGLKIWIYTGYRMTDVIMVWSDLLKFVDIIKCGKYEESLQCDGFPASSNQKIYKLNEFGVGEEITKLFRRD